MMMFRTALLFCAILFASFFLNTEIAFMGGTVPGTLPTTGAGLDGNLISSLSPIVLTLGALGAGVLASRRRK